MRSGRVFLSYRREDAAFPAAWLYERLVGRFGPGEVFKDVDSIDFGDDFAEVIRTAVSSCDVLVAMIGPEWATIRDADGHRRLDDPNDFVRLEIETALQRDVRVVPILVEGARLPRAEQLPGSLAKLVRRQAMELSPNQFEYDTTRLLRVIENTIAQQPRIATQSRAAARQLHRKQQEATASPRPAIPAAPSPVITPSATPAAEQPMPGSDEGVPSPAAAPVGGPPGPSRRRVSRWAVFIAALIALAVPAFVIVQVVIGSGSGTANVAAATRQCQTALAAADQTLPDGQEVAHQLRVHAGFMNQMQPANGYAPQVRYLGRPSLTAGALAAGKYQDKLVGYRTLSAGCLSSAASPQPCKARVAAADQAFEHASNVVTALQQHTAIMDQWDSGQLTAYQAHDLGQASLNTGLSEANALDQSARTYQTAGTC